MKRSGLKVWAAMASVSPLAVLAVLAPISARAQTAQTQTVQVGALPALTVDPDNTIVVVGTRRQNRDAIAAKRSIDAVADFVTADDIAQLPDFNVAEALRRIPGVSLQLDFRFDREGFVSVRGLNSTYNYTQMDGGTIASTVNNERTVLLDIVPSSVLARAEVFKSFTPDQEGQAIGGYISLRTRSAFDRGSNFSNFTIDYGITENEGWEDKGPTFRATGAYSTKFGLNDQFGLTLAGSYSQEDRFLYNPEVRTYFYYDAVSGQRLTADQAAASTNDVQSAARIDAQFAWRYDREFFGGLSKLEWKPSSNAYTFVQAYYYDFFERSDRQGVEWDWRTNTRPVGQTELTGRVETLIRSTPALVTWDTTNRIWSLQSGGTYTLFDRHKLSFNALYSEGTFSDPTSQYRTGFDTIGNADRRLAYTYDHAGNVTNFPVRTLVNDGAYNNLSLYGALPGHRYWGSDNLDKTFEAKIDYQMPLSVGVGDLALKFGAKLARVAREQDQSWVDYDLNTNVPLAQYNLGLFSTNRNFRLPTGTHNHPLWITDQNLIQGYFDANPQNFTARASTLGLGIVDDFTVEETVWAGYLQAEYEAGPFELIAGIRFERTEVSSDGFRPATGPSATNGFAPITDSNSYDNWLPRALVTYDFTETLVAKAAFSRSVSRPSYSDLRANRSTLRYDPVFRSASIAGGNTDLEPRTADNFDLSLEYYPNWMDGMVSVALFKKDISDEVATPRIVTQGVVITPLADGGFVFGDTGSGAVTVDLAESIPINLDTYTIEGFEAGVVINDFSFVHPLLSFLGASANYTYVGSDATITRAGGDKRKLPTLIGQPEHLANTSIFAQFGGFEARLAYNYQSEYLYSLAGALADDDLWNARGLFSAQLRYKLTDNIVLLARSNNLTGETIDSRTGFGNFRQLRDSGTLHWIGISFKR